MNLTEIRERQFELQEELARLREMELQLLDKVFPPAGINWTNERYAAHLRHKQQLHYDDHVLLEMILSELAEIVYKIELDNDLEAAKRSTRELYTAILNGDYNHLLGSNSEDA